MAANIYYGRFFQPHETATTKTINKSLELDDFNKRAHEVHSAGAKVVVALHFAPESHNHSVLAGHDFVLGFAQTQYKLHLQAPSDNLPLQPVASPTLCSF